MFPPTTSYQGNPHAITIVFDIGDLKEASLCREFRKSFGEGYYLLEQLDPPNYCSLDLLPGGALRAGR